MSGARVPVRLRTQLTSSRFGALPEIQAKVRGGEWVNLAALIEKVPELRVAWYGVLDDPKQREAMHRGEIITVYAEDER